MNLEIIDISKDESYVATEPVLLPEAKAWCLIDYPDDDSLLTSLITRSRKAIENFCHISICPKTITAFLKNPVLRNYEPDMFNYRWDAGFYGWPISYQWNELPYGPVSTIQSVTAVDAGGTMTILNQGTDYFVTGLNFKEIRVQSWADQLIIIYSTPYYCPDDLKEAILNEIAFRYENRGSGVNRYAKQSVAYSEGAQALALPFQRAWL